MRTESTLKYGPLLFWLILANDPGVHDRDQLRSATSLYEDSEDSSDDASHYLEGEREGKDTDDEVEEANAADDGIKIIEDNW